MLRRNAPLLVRPHPSWHKLSWFAEFLGNIPRYGSNTIETARLAIAAREHLFSWADAEGIDFDLRRQGNLHIYRNKSGFEHASHVSTLLAKGGLQRRAVSQDEMRSIEPTLAGQYYGGFYTESDAPGDIHKFTHGLAVAAERRGVEFRYQSRITDLTVDGHAVTLRASTEQGEERSQFDGVVVAAGVASRALAARVGDRINIYPVKGYSITVNLNDEHSRSAAPTVSLLDNETKLVSSRLGADRFWVAGTTEFAGMDKDIRDDRIRPLIEWMNQCFPGVNTRSVVPWAGLRPMRPNMLPRVGRGRSPRVFYNTGHGHLSWTLSAVTADTVAGVVQGASRSLERRLVGAAA